MVIDRTPSVKGILGMHKVSKALLTQHLGLECSVEAFVFALSLRVEGPAVIDSDAQAHQPDLEAGIGRASLSAPGIAIVHHHALRQPVATEDVAKTLLTV